MFLERNIFTGIFQAPGRSIKLSTRVSMEVIVTIVSKLVYNLFMGLTT